MSALTWVLLAAGLGLASSGILSGMLGLERTPFVLGHALIVAALFGFYLFWEQIRFGPQLRRRWPGGLTVGLLFGAVLARTVLTGPGSERPAGAELALAFGWHGVVYGIADALLLSVLPVLAVYGSRSKEQLAEPVSRWRWALAALAASVLITSLYHLGFREFRGVALIRPIIGTAIVTVAYLLAGNPLAPILAHVMMHLAAVWHGMAATAQLPPHY